ncbi:uncharacterized protein LOC144588671 [Pogona vitticeps]
MDANNCTILWQNILISTITSMFCLLGLIVLYGKLCKKIEIYACKHDGGKQPRLRSRKNDNTAPREEFSAETNLMSEHSVVSKWLNMQPNVQQLQKQNVQANSHITGSSSGSSPHSLTRQHSDSDDEINYTTIVFGDSGHDPSTVEDYEDQNVNVHYENVSP